MEKSRPMVLKEPARDAESALSTAEVAKGALRRLAQSRMEPSPENYAHAFDEELGVTPRPVLPARAVPVLQKLAAGLLPDEAKRIAFLQAFSRGYWKDVEQQLESATGDEARRGDELARLVERILDGVDRGTRQWTRARRKEGLHRVLASSRSDFRRLQHRLSQLVSSWERDAGSSDEAEAGVETIDSMPADLPVPVPDTIAASLPTVGDSSWQLATMTLGDTVVGAMPQDEAHALALAESLQQWLTRSANEGIDDRLSDELQRLCREARAVLKRRQQLLGHTQELTLELTEALTELAEDDSWAKGQCEAIRARLAQEPTLRGLRSVGELLRDARERQRTLRLERAKARDGLKAHINQILLELGELGSQTGRFHESVSRHAELIEKADTLESLAGAVRDMVEESRTVHVLVSQTQARLQSEHERAAELSQNVQSLEDNLRRLSDEIAIDPLTQVANRRGLVQAFEVERARFERTGDPLAVALLDVDNFKKLNDSLGHAAGDQALVRLAERVRHKLRPTDLVARYGGEEFVLMLPDANEEQAREVLTRMQRALTESLFMHEGRQVFVTFSAGLTIYRRGESIEEALERADDALYEAKRTGKNRTCVA